MPKIRYVPGSWRARAAPIIAEVIERVGTEDMRTLRRALRDAFPWGARAMHPYKIWLDEIRVQLGYQRPPRAGRSSRRMDRHELVAALATDDRERGQEFLFDVEAET